MKKILAIILALMLCVTLLAACGDSAGDMFMTYFFHFYPEIPGLGAVYYAGFAMNQITFSGTYEVVEQETEYTCWPALTPAEAAGEGAAPPTGTAPYARDVDVENSAFKTDYDGEKATALLSLIDPNDETATLDLLVNGKYNDAVIMFVAGTWSMNEDQTQITLTPDSAGDNGTVRLYASAFGSEFDIDSADSYDVDMESYVITVHFKTAGDIATVPYGVSMDYAATGIELFGDVTSTLNMVTE